MWFKTLYIDTKSKVQQPKFHLKFLCHARSNAIATGALFNDNFNTRNPSPKIIKYSENSDNFESTYGLYLFLQQIILITKSELKNPVLR